MAFQLLPSQLDGVEDVTQLLLHIDFFVQPLHITWLLKRVREVRSFGGKHLHFHVHRLGDDENVGEDDGCIKEVSVSPNGLQSDLCGQLRSAAALEEVVLFSQRAEFYRFRRWGVSTSWQRVAG